MTNDLFCPLDEKLHVRRRSRVVFWVVGTSQVWQANGFLGEHARRPRDRILLSIVVSLAREVEFFLRIRDTRSLKLGN